MNCSGQHENGTVDDIMFIKWWHDIAAKCRIAKKKQTTILKKKNCIKLKTTVVNYILHALLKSTIV